MIGDQTGENLSAPPVSDAEGSGFLDRAIGRLTHCAHFDGAHFGGPHGMFVDVPVGDLKAVIAALAVRMVAPTSGNSSDVEYWAEIEDWITFSVERLRKGGLWTAECADRRQKAKEAWARLLPLGTEPSPSFAQDTSGLLEALRACRLELFWCAKQLAAKGMKGREGDSVSRALELADKVIAEATALSTPTPHGV